MRNGFSFDSKTQKSIFGSRGNPLVFFLVSNLCGLSWWASLIVAAIGWLIYFAISDKPKLKVMASNDTTKRVYLPMRGTSGSSGLDLYYSGEVEKILRPGQRKRFSTKLMFKIPDGYTGFVKSRSSLALNYIDVKAGVIDMDYRGVVDVVLHNAGTKPFKVEHGDRIAQLVLLKCGYFEPKFSSDFDETRRGDGSFGSTDLKTHL